MEHSNEQETLYHNLGAEMRNGARWFFWIAALSFINSLIITFGGGLSFIIGLGVSQLVDAVFQGMSAGDGVSAMRIAGLGVSVAIAGLFVGFGYFARKGAAWAFILGSVLYVLDGLLCLTLGSYLAAAFHGFALFFIVKGLIASRRLFQGED